MNNGKFTEMERITNTHTINNKVGCAGVVLVTGMATMPANGRTVGE